jgi:2-succinyl-6-hydroxy-2,4-cyclohexadiene-1-carboxylate synthase
MKKITIRGVDHYYQFFNDSCKDSSKPVLVFIHGWLLSQSFWEPLIEQLKDSYPCLAYDLKGFGQSQLPLVTKEKESSSAPFSLEDYSQDLRELLRQLKIKKAWLIGHSLGGSVALWGADICPQIIEGVICINAGGGIYLEEEFQRFRKAGESLVKFRPSWLLNVPLLDLVFARMMVKRPLARYWGKQRLKDFLGADEQAALGSLLESTTEEQVHYLPQIVSRLSQPVHFIAGKQDFVMEVKYVKHLASFHSLFYDQQRNVHEIDECGHFAMLEQTVEVYKYTLKVIQESHQENSLAEENVTIDT